MIDGKLRVLAGTDDRSFDTAKLRLLRLRDSAREAFYVVRAIIDVAPLEDDIKEGAKEADTRGYVVVGGRATPLLDAAAVVAKWGDELAREAQ